MNIKLNVRSILKSDLSKTENYIELFNYKLLKIIIYLENQGGIS